MSDNDLQQIREAILDEHTFIRATFSGGQRGQQPPWVKIAIRPVLLKSGRHLQFSYFDARKDITKNYAGEEAAERLDEVLGMPFGNITVQTSTGDLQVRFSKKGKPLIHHSKPAEVREIDLSHDREKQTILSATSPDPYLKAVGIMTHDGKIRASMQSKSKQINEFLRLLSESKAFDLFSREQPLHVVDCGCGNAYLTFAAYHYLTSVLGFTVDMVGIDVKEELMLRHNENARALGWEGLRFQHTSISDYHPETPPDMVIALHACDTATDDAIALGVRAESRLIVCAPCCQHDLQRQLDEQPTPLPFAPVMRYGIMHEQIGTILTDSFRALLLRALGYHTDIVEFIGGEHTPKNLMIRAVRTGKPGEARAVQEYQELKAFWKVTPYLEQLLAYPLENSHADG